MDEFSHKIARYNNKKHVCIRLDNLSHSQERKNSVRGNYM